MIQHIEIIFNLCITKPVFDLWNSRSTKLEEFRFPHIYDELVFHYYTTPVMPSVSNTLPEKSVSDLTATATSLLSRDFESLTNIDEIRECLRLLDEEETRIDASLDEMLAQETKLDSSLNVLEALK